MRLDSNTTLTIDLDTLREAQKDGVFSDIFEPGVSIDDFITASKSGDVLRGNTPISFSRPRASAFLTPQVIQTTCDILDQIVGGDKKEI